MKKASCVLIIVLLLLLEISAKAEWVSIVELRQQVDEMGRWIQNYTDTYGRQIEVDVLPMIPNVEVVPILRVEPLDVVPDQIHPDIPLTTTNNEEGSRHYYDSETGEWMRLYEVCKGTICIEYANQDISSKEETGQFGSLRGKSFCLDESNPDISYKERSILKGCVETISHVMKKIFPDKTPEYSFIWLEEISEDVPCAVLALRQKIAGIPVLMGAGDPVAYASEEEIGFPKPDRSDAAKIQLCNRLEADEKMISYLDGTCRMEIEPIQKTEQLEEDVPLCSFDKVQSTVEKLIQNGYIRRVYALRFGYCCYRDVEGGNVLYPVWQIECDYAFDSAKQLSPDESYPVMERMHYSTMIVNAQTGEFMNPVKLKDRLLDAPKVTSWKDVR